MIELSLSFYCLTQTWFLGHATAALGPGSSSRPLGVSSRGRGSSGAVRGAEHAALPPPWHRADLPASGPAVGHVADRHFGDSEARGRSSCGQHCAPAHRPIGKPLQLTPPPSPLQPSRRISSPARLLAPERLLPSAHAPHTFPGTAGHESLRSVEVLFFLF